MTEIEAKEFAIKVHGEQQYGDKPYAYHLESVVQIAKELGLKKDIILGCWLHDTIEDCDVTYQDVEVAFGEVVAEIVYAVTDELGRNRKERKAKTYPKIRANEDALCVKLCDRIANINQSIVDEKFDLLSMYFKEHKAFKAELYTPNHGANTIELWGVLEDLIEKASTLMDRESKGVFGS